MVKPEKIDIVKHFCLSASLHGEIESYRIQSFNGEYFLSWSGAVRELIKKGLDAEK